MTMPGKRGLYEGTDKEGNFWQIPRNADPDLDGTAFAAHHPQLFDAGEAPDSVPLADFDRRLEAAVPQDVLRRIDRTVEAGIFLAQKGLADTPPAEVREWRRGMILSWSHARDLAVVHDALDHPRDTSGHDVDEIVLAKHVKARLTSADQWYSDYVNSLDEGALINVGFFNPNISASMYKWGDAKGGVQNAMDAHRLAAHHQGTPERPLDWVERAVNFVVHHIPREHWGIRHEPRGGWDDLEHRLAEDPAIKDAEIGKVIARDAARMFQMLELEGKVIPWQLLKVPADALTPSVVEHAYLVVLAANRHRLRKEAGESDEFDDEDESRNPARVARAQAILDRLPVQLRSSKPANATELAAAFKTWAAANG